MVGSKLLDGLVGIIAVILAGSPSGIDQVM